MQEEDRSEHFIGSIINISEREMPTGIQKYMIIDGQQCMATLMLLLIAHRDYSRSHPEDNTIKQGFKKIYILYKVHINFIDIIPQKSRLRLSLNMKFNETLDPNGLCVGVIDKGRWGNGDIEVGFENSGQLRI